VKLPLVTSGDSALPPLHARWVDAWLGEPLPHEVRASCDRCAMVLAPGQVISDIDSFFDPDTKCCTYKPALANFLVGGLLADAQAHPAGRASIEARIDARAGVTPLGLLVPEAEELAYQDRAKAGGFGRDVAQRCPHYVEEGGLCGLWRHRPAPCATYFCRFLRGAVSAGFWNALEQMLTTVERVLRDHCLVEIGFDAAALTVLFPPRRSLSPGTPRRDPEADGVYAETWGAWLGRERELYRACAEIVQPLGWSDILALAGPELRLRIRVAEHAYRALFDEHIPERLRVARVTAAQSELGRMRVRAYSRTDPIEVPMQVAAAFGAFDGRPRGEVLAEVAATLGTRIDDDQLRQLVDFGVLVKRP
jgi:hypothetical protein